MVATTRSHVMRVYKNREVPGRSGMEFGCTVDARRRVHSDTYQAVPHSAPPQL